MKYVVLIALAAVACRMMFGRWPWELWRASERSQKRAQARALLGVDRSAGRDEILAAHRRAMQSAHPDRGGSEDQVYRINAARDLLLERHDMAE